MNLQLLDTRIISLSLKKNETLHSDAEKIFKLNTGNSFSPENPRIFAVFFNLSIANPEFELILETSYWFETNEDITESFKLSEFVNVNAPAIAFPFLRAYVGNITLLSGYKPVMLPSINFIELAKAENNL